MRPVKSSIDSPNDVYPSLPSVIAYPANVRGPDTFPEALLPSTEYPSPRLSSLDDCVDDEEFVHATCELTHFGPAPAKSNGCRQFVHSG